MWQVESLLPSMPQKSFPPGQTWEAGEGVPSVQTNKRQEQEQGSDILKCCDYRTVEISIPSPQITDSRHIHAGGGPDRYHTHNLLYLSYCTSMYVHYIMQYEMQSHTVLMYSTRYEKNKKTFPPCMW